MTLDPITVSALGSVLAAVATASAVLVAVKALQATRRAALADQLLISIGDMLTGLAELADRARTLNEVPGGESRSRDELAASFRRYQVADTRVRLLEPTLGRDWAYGEWVRGVANNFAASLLQADEFASWMQPGETGLSAADKPLEVTAEEWQVLSRSLAYQAILRVGLTPHQTKKGFVPLERWYKDRVLQSHHDDFLSVYSVQASYLVQHVRLLEDFVREYVEPWAQDLVSKGFKLRRRTAVQREPIAPCPHAH